MTLVTCAFTHEIDYVPTRGRSIRQASTIGYIDVEVPDYSITDAPIAIEVRARGAVLASAKRRLINRSLFRAFDGALVGSGSVESFQEAMRSVLAMEVLAGLPRPRLPLLTEQPMARRIEKDDSPKIAARVRDALEQFCFIDGTLHKRSDQPVIQIALSNTEGLSYYHANVSGGRAPRKMMTFSAERVEALRDFRRQVLQSQLQVQIPDSPDGIEVELHQAPVWRPFPETHANTRALVNNLIGASTGRQIEGPELKRLNVEPDLQDAMPWSLGAISYARSRIHPLHVARQIAAAAAAIEWSGDFMPPSSDPDLESLTI